MVGCWTQRWRAAEIMSWVDVCGHTSDASMTLQAWKWTSHVRWSQRWNSPVWRGSWIHPKTDLQVTYSKKGRSVLFSKVLATILPSAWVSCLLSPLTSIYFAWRAQGRLENDCFSQAINVILSNKKEINWKLDILALRCGFQEEKDSLFDRPHLQWHPLQGATKSKHIDLWLFCGLIHWEELNLGIFHALFNQIPGLRSIQLSAPIE